MFKILKKIILNVLKFWNIPKKIVKKIIYFQNKKNFKNKNFENEQKNFFSAVNLDREGGLIKLNRFKQDFPSFNNEMSSEHDILFASLSLKINTETNEILEIGTFNGKNAFLLSKLFDKGKIVTIDLPKDDLTFQSIYDSRKDDFYNFINERDKILNQKNISFLEKNSIQLINEKRKFDVIWVDGAHNYPTVAIDIINSINLLKPNGLLICDDIITKKDIHKESIYSSIASLDTLKILHNQKIISLNLIYKKIDLVSLCNPDDQNYLRKISISKKL